MGSHNRTVRSRPQTGSRPNQRKSVRLGNLATCKPWPFGSGWGHKADLLADRARDPTLLLVSVADIFAFSSVCNHLKPQGPQ